MIPLCMTATRPALSQVRVGVGVGGPAVRRPAGVPDAGVPGRQRPVLQLLLQIDELARLLRGGQPSVREDRDPGGVVAPVLQPLQTREDDVLRRLLPDVTHDSAHIGTIRPVLPARTVRRHLPLRQKCPPRM